MRIIMWSRWSSLIIGIALSFFVLLAYWQSKISSIENEQKNLGLKLGLTSQNYIGNFDYNLNRGVSGFVEDPVIIYNRIPKTGSTSLMGLAYELCNRNNFHVVHLNTTKNSHVLNPADQLRFANNVTGWVQKRPAIFHGHMGYLDFSSLGVSLRPIYINVVRDPLERLISYYYFLRFGDNFRPEVNRKRKGNKETFDECVEREGIDCDPSNLWMQIPFFCGHHYMCWEAGNSWALQQAKSNLANNYFLVGTTENIVDFVNVLEATLPRFFRGALELFNSEGKSHLRKTFGKQAPTKETIKKFRRSKIWQMEQDFYMFAKKNFNAVKKRTFPSSSDSANSPAPQQFRFEKIRPK